MKVTVEYSTMIIENMEESVAFYQDILGFEVVSVHELGPAGRITLMRGQGGAMVELIESTNYEIGLYSVGMDVDNLAETLEQVRSKGAKVTMEPMKTSVGSMAFIEDPNGVRIALIEHDK
ncbi:MAG: VOC family protein [Raoultibacter sp.]|jgi:lactoylglutathione lyase